MREKEIEIEHERELETEEDERQPEYELRNRKALIVLMALCTILESGLAGVLSGQALDRCIVLLFLGIICILLAWSCIGQNMDGFIKKWETTAALPCAMQHPMEHHCCFYFCLALQGRSCFSGWRQASPQAPFGEWHRESFISQYMHYAGKKASL